MYDWLFRDAGLKQYPGFRITLYNADGTFAYDNAIVGNDLRDKKTGEAGAKVMIAKLDNMLVAADKSS